MATLVDWSSRDQIVLLPRSPDFCPLVEKLSTYLKDTTDFLNHIKHINETMNLLPSTILVTADMTSLYTNINHKDGLKACQNTLNMRPNLSPPTSQLICFLELVLTLNNFKFNDVHYIQTRGTEMGTSCAPSYANLMMGALEEEKIHSSPTSQFCTSRYKQISARPIRNKKRQILHTIQQMCSLVNIDWQQNIIGQLSICHKRNNSTALRCFPGWNKIHSYGRKFYICLIQILHMLGPRG